MIKLGGTICDRCRTLIRGRPGAKKVVSRKKKTKLDFCSEYCMLVYFKGKKYYARKIELMRSKHVEVN